jgi:hypothetical protein
MSKKSKIESLPKAVRDWLSKELVLANFQGYDRLVEMLNERLQAEGLLERISRSGLKRHGIDLERQIEAVQAAGLAANALVDSDADPSDKMNQATIRMLQARLFNVVANPEGIKDLPATIRAAAELGRVSISAKKHAEQVLAAKLHEQRQALTALHKEGVVTQASMDAVMQRLGIAKPAEDNA